MPKLLRIRIRILEFKFTLISNNFLVTTSLTRIESFRWTLEEAQYGFFNILNWSILNLKNERGVYNEPCLNVLSEKIMKTKKNLSETSKLNKIKSFTPIGFYERSIQNLQWPNLKNLSGGLNLSRGLNMVGST